MRRRLGQSADAGHRPSGLARRVENLTARLVILPGDPFATDLSFGDQFWGWWTTNGPSPFGAQVEWTKTEVTVNAAVKYRLRSATRTAYLALHRHGGVELGCDPSWLHSHRERFFRLLHTVGLVWIGASAQAQAVDRFGIVGPWELTMVFHETENSYLAGFGNGWREPHQGGVLDLRAQQEPHVMIRRELATFPASENDVRDLGFDVGARIEDAWGVKYRRFLDCHGDMKGKFNPGRWSW